MDTFKHHLPLQIRFNDVDQMGHVNNAVIMEYFDLGKSHYFHDAGIPVGPEAGDFTVMIVHYEVDFVGQILYQDSLEVCTRLEKIGTKSLTLLQEVRSDGVAKALCRTVMAGYSRSEAASAVIPDSVRTQIQNYEKS